MSKVTENGELHLVIQGNKIVRYCSSLSTAERLMADFPRSKVKTMPRYDLTAADTTYTLGPINLTMPNEDDNLNESKVSLRKAAYERALEAGATKEDLDLLAGRT